jgi:hypothetical protein
MDLDREKFSKEMFNSKEFLNNMYNKSLNNNNNKNNAMDSDIFSFKLKIIQREFSNEIDLNSNNVLKSTKTIQDDLNSINKIYSVILNKMDNLLDKKIKSNSKGNFSKKKCEQYLNINKNIDKSIEYLK